LVDIGVDPSDINGRGTIQVYDNPLYSLFEMCGGESSDVPDYRA
jgi:hypothetical protein